MFAHVAMRLNTFLSAADNEGLTVWSAIQHPYLLQSQLAKLLGLPIAKVRVIAPDPGGAFGGKQHAKFEPLVAFLSLRTSRPCRLALTLAQTFQAVRRTAYRVLMRTGFDTDGRLLFQDVTT